MAKKVWSPEVIIGDRAKIGLLLDIDESGDGLGMLWISGVPIWFKKGKARTISPFSWSWIDFLAYLGSNWKYFFMEEGYPSGLDPYHPYNYFNELSEVRHQADDNNAKRIDNDSFLFESRHNLAWGMSGVTLPYVLVLREGLAFWITSKNASVTVGINEFKAFLSELGEYIRRKVINNKYAKYSVNVWEHREKIDVNDCVAIRSSSLLDSEFVDEFCKIVPADKVECDNILYGDYELLAAARMTANVIGTDERIELIKITISLAKGSFEKIANISEESYKHIKEYPNAIPFKQGYHLARFIRRMLHIKANDVVDPEEILNSLGVQICDITTDDKLDALAVWGSHHGPAILINISERSRAGTVHGRRSTLAHELCHILIDRKESLPVAEVLGGRVPLRVEQRANAFAAELLLPRQVAIERALSSADIEEALTHICNTFGVGKVLASCQIFNSRLFHKLSIESQNVIQSTIEPYKKFYEMT